MNELEAGSLIWHSIFEHVVDQLAADIAATRRHLLTEDRLRWALIVALNQSGVDADRLATEVRVPGIGPVDLVVGHPPSIVVELKFPRDPVATNAPDTMTAGELLRDFARLAACGASRQAIALHVLPDRLRRHLNNRRDVRWAWEPGQELELTPEIATAMPKTARDSMRLDEFVGTITATCIFAGSTGDLSILVYEVAPICGSLRFKPR